MVGINRILGLLGKAGVPGWLFALRESNQPIQSAGTLRDWFREGFESRIRYYPGGFTNFRKDWSFCRTLMPLQVRLICEQTFFDIGGAYESLVTGFSPVKTRTRKQK